MRSERYEVALLVEKLMNLPDPESVDSLRLHVPLITAPGLSWFTVYKDLGPMGIEWFIEVIIDD